MRKNNQRGFAIGPVLVVVALIAIIGAAFTASNRGTSNQNNNSSAKSYAGLVMYQSSHLKHGFERYLGDGISLADIEWTSSPSAAGKTALFAPFPGYAVMQKPPPQAVTGVWSRGGLSVPGVGSGAINDVLLLNGVSRDACAWINASLYGADTNQSPVSFGVISSSSVTPGAASVNATGRAEGCVAANSAPLASDYVFYSAIKIN